MLGDNTDLAQKIQKEGIRALIASAEMIMNEDLREHMLKSLEGLAGPYPDLLKRIQQDEILTEEEINRHQRLGAEAEEMTGKVVYSDNQAYLDKLHGREAGNIVKFIGDTASLMGFTKQEVQGFLKAGRALYHHIIGEDGRLNMDRNSEQQVRVAKQFIAEKDELIEKIRGGRDHSELSKQEKQKIAVLNKMCAPIAIAMGLAKEGEVMGSFQDKIAARRPTEGKSRLSL